MIYKILFLFILSSNYLFANNIDDVSYVKLIDILEKKIPLIMHKYKTPGVSISLIRNNQIVWSKGFGVKKKGYPDVIDKETIFEAASMSKPVFAYTALKLVDKGKIDLYKPLDKYLKKPYFPDQPKVALITAQMVLSHTSGLPNWRKKGKPLKLYFEPGTGKKYSGEGYRYLQKAVERITGIRLDKYINKVLFKPLQLSRSSFVWKKEFKKNYARGHDKKGEYKSKRRFYKKPNAAFTLYTTANDYARFLLHVMNNSTNKGLQTKTYKGYTTIQQPVKGKTSGKQRTFGWSVKDKINFLEHSGANGTGFRTYARLDITNKSGVVILTNAKNGKKTYKKIIKLIDKFDD
ncbi:MAG: serine hydrolase domain-containing protein [Pseudomonadota bacterium]